MRVATRGSFLGYAVTPRTQTQTSVLNAPSLACVHLSKQNLTVLVWRNEVEPSVFAVAQARIADAMQRVSALPRRTLISFLALTVFALYFLVRAWQRRTQQWAQEEDQEVEQAALGEVDVNEEW